MNSYFYEPTPTSFWDGIDGWFIFLVIAAAILLVIVIALICAIFEINNSLKDIKKILIKDYNEKHPDNKLDENICEEKNSLQETP